MTMMIFSGPWTVILEGKLMVRFDRNFSQWYVEWTHDPDLGWEKTPWKTNDIDHLCDEAIFNKVRAWLDLRGWPEVEQ